MSLVNNFEQKFSEEMDELRLRLDFKDFNRVITQLSKKIRDNMSLVAELIITLYTVTDEELCGLFQQILSLSVVEKPSSHKPIHSLISTICSSGKVYKLIGTVSINKVSGRNLIHYLAEFGYPRTLEVLLSYAADNAATVAAPLETMDGAGLYPRDIANTECKEILLQYSSLLRLPLSNKECSQLLRNYKKALIIQEDRQRLEKLNQAYQELNLTLPSSVLPNPNNMDLNNN